MGIADGPNDGTADEEGSKVAPSSVGAGVAVGTNVGITDGIALGEALGTNEGVALGSKVGTALGS